MTYIGRFAPTPSGPLHFGSLIAATASYLDAKSHHGKWLVRIEDLDTPRVVSGSIDQIFFQLDAYGFQWDANPVYQSQRGDLYQHALDQLLVDDHAFYCECTRKQLFERNPQGIYDGHCRKITPRDPKQCSVRFKVPAQRLEFTDLIQARVDLDAQMALGDFIIKRRDGFFGYHLACAVDDLAQGITHVVRGHDLLSSSFAQRLITYALNKNYLSYGHHPVAVNHQQIKYSKSAKSRAIGSDKSVATLWQALTFLGQQPPSSLQKSDLNTLWTWAFEHWQLTRIPTTGWIEI